jgi:G3E family GTPase
MSFLLLPIATAAPDAIRDACVRAAAAFSNEAQPSIDDTPSQPGPICVRIEVGPGGSRHRFEISNPGCYALFTEHHPNEFNLRVERAGVPQVAQAQMDFKPSHEHDSDIGSVGFHISGDFDRAKLDAWFGLLLREHGTDIFRMKGILSLRGEPARYVFQGVHMLLDVMPSRPWGSEARESRFVFIGRNLDREILDTGFRACLAS